MRARSPPSCSAGSRPAGLFGAGAAGASPVASSAEGLINAAALLLQGHDAERVALVCGDQQLTHGELRDRVARAAAAGARGLERGHRVATNCPTAGLGGGLPRHAAGGRHRGGGESEDPGARVALHPRRGGLHRHPRRERRRHAAALARQGRAGRRRRGCPRPARWRRARSTPDTPAFWAFLGHLGQAQAVVHAHRFAREVERVSRAAGHHGRRSPRSPARASSQTNSLWAGLKLGATVVLDPQWPTAQSVVATGGRDAADGAVQRPRSTA